VLDKETKDLIDICLKDKNELALYLNEQTNRKKKSVWKGLNFQIMANADEFCQFARLGQTSKIQKCLQTHCE
jgi:hypothetical protein